MKLKAKRQILIIKLAFVLIIILYIIYKLSSIQNGFLDGFYERPVERELSVWSGLLMSVEIVVFCLIVFDFYKFINSAEHKKVFSKQNINRISRLGWCCTLQSFVLYGFYYNITIDKIPFASMYESMIEVNFEFWLLTLGITLLTISFIFKKGMELQLEQDLTI